MHVCILRHLRKVDRKLVAWSQGCKVAFDHSDVIYTGRHSRREVCRWMHAIQPRVHDSPYWQVASYGAAYGGDAEMLQWCVSMGAHLHGTTAIAAANGGSIACMMMIPSELLSARTLDVAIGNMSGVQDWLYNTGVRWRVPRETIFAYKQKVESYEWLIAHGYVLGEYDVYMAACYNNRAMLELFWKCNRELFTIKIAKIAAHYCDMSTLIWMHNNGCDFTGAGSRATRRADISVLEWLYGVGVREFTFRRTTAEVLQWLHKKGYPLPWDRVVHCNIAAIEWFDTMSCIMLTAKCWYVGLHNSPEVIKWLYAHDCPRGETYDVLRRTKKKSHFDAVFECGLVPTEDEVVQIIKKGSVEAVQWLYEKGLTSLAEIKEHYLYNSRQAVLTKWLDGGLHEYN